MEYSKAQYRRERALVDQDWQWTRERMAENGNRANFVTAAQLASKPRKLSKVDNAMRGRVERFELLRDLPDRFTAYLENGKPDNQGARLAVTCWPGDALGFAVVHTVARRRSRFADCLRYGRAWIGGREYSWQGPGAGMYAHFRAVKAKG